MNRKGSPSQSGSMLTIVAVMLLAMAGLAVAVLRSTKASTSLQRQDRQSAHARYIAQTGLSTAMFNLQRGQSGALGSSQAPVVWDKSHYYVTQQNVTADILRLTATGLDDRAAARQELVVRQLPTTIWRFGAFGKEDLHMDSNARVDSYNSDTGTYILQDVNGSGTNTHAASNGDVGSNGDISLSQNAKVWGDATPGPSHNDTILGNAFVTGSTSSNSQAVVLPTITVPSYSSFGALTVAGTTTIPSGNRSYTNITGPAKIVMSNLTLKSGAQININATNGDVELWVIDNFILNSNAQIAPTDFKSKHLRLNLLSDNVINPELNVQLDTVEFDSNSKFYGTILAPSAAITVSSNFEMFGSVVARSVDLHSNANFHFDEALLNATSSGLPTFETISWREVPYAP
jgi:hypothetical protein